MKVVHRCKASRVSPQVEGEDVISSMPEDVIANIMNCLPLRDAVGTSILSTSWRSKWTLLTQLIFDFKFFIMLARRKSHFDKTNISRLLHQLKGAITKFVLHITDYMELDADDFHHLVMFLSRIRGFKELTLIYHNESTPVKLLTHLFSCLELKHLKLQNCVLSPLPYYRGFPKLLSLDLLNVRFPDHRCGELIAQCPLLERLEISSYKLGGEVKLVEIAKLKNVKMLTLSLWLLDNMTMVRLSTLFEHMSLQLPKLEKLQLCFLFYQFLAEDVAQNPVSTIFPFLKSLDLYAMDFSSVSMLSCVFGMLFGCTNLQTLNIIGRYKNVVSPPAIFSPEVYCSTMGQLQLRNVYLSNIKGLENEVCLIKYTLACSPMLKRIIINSSKVGNDSNEKYKVKYKLASNLLKLHRASPMAEIIF